MLRRPSRRTPYLGVLQAERAAHEPRGIVLILIRRQTLQIGHLRCVAGYMDNEIGRREPSCGGQTYYGDSGTDLRPGSSLSSTSSEAGSSSRSTTLREAEIGMTSGFCSVLALLSWALSAGE